MKPNYVGRITIVILLLGLIWFSIQIIYSKDYLQRYPTGSFNRTQYFKINPDTVLVSIDKNEDGVFQLAEDASFEKINEKTFSWTQEDYNNIANEVSFFAWGEALDGWNLYRMIFRTSCRDNPIGFDYAAYVFFKETTYNNEIKYSARSISISPQYGDIAAGSDTTFPRPFWGWDYIETKSISITADEAMQSAEKNGGQGARLAMQNKCQIYVSMNPNDYNHVDWKVVYSGNNASTELQVVIPSN